MKGLSNRSHNQITIPDLILEKDKRTVCDFISNFGQFDDLVVDFKNVKAFTEM